MATALTAIKLGRNGQVDATAGVAITTSSGAYIDVSDIDASKLIFEIVTTGVDTILIKDGGLYSAEGIGDLSVTSTDADTIYVGPLETARFKDTDGYINVIPSTASTSTSDGHTVRAILLP